MHRVENIPFSLRASLSSSSSSETIATTFIDNNIDARNENNNNCDAEEALRRAEYHENIDKYYNMFQKKFKQKMDEIQNDTSNLNQMEELLKNLNSIIDDIGTSSASLPPKQT